jgi:hypothetical protein
MKKLVTIVLTLLIPLFVTSPLFAQNNFSNNTNSTLPRDTTINSDYFATGETVTISGTVNGDVYAAGSTVLVDGIINGDLLVAGGDVTIRGTVTEDVRTAGGNIVIASQIAGNTTALGGNVTITDSASLSGSLVTATGNLEVFGQVQRGMTMGAGTATIGNSTQGDITAGVGMLTLTADASVSGNLNYWSEEDAQIAETASITGAIQKHVPEQGTSEVKESVVGIITGFAVMIKLMSFVTALIIGLLLVKFFPRFTTNTAQTFLSQPLSAGLIGLVALIVIPVVIILFFITILGIPIALLIMMIYLVDLFIAKIFVAYAAGIWLVKRTNSQWRSGWILLAGLLLYYILTAIPIFGGFVSFISLIVGLGSLLISKRNYHRELTEKNVL